MARLIRLRNNMNHALKLGLEDSTHVVMCPAYFADEYNNIPRQVAPICTFSTIANVYFYSYVFIDQSNKQGISILITTAATIEFYDFEFVS